MALGENLDNLSKDIKEYIKRSVAGYKLRLIDILSHIAGDLLCSFVLWALLLMVLLFLLVAAVVALAPIVGLLQALLLAAMLLAILAIMIYLCRTSLFTDRVVRRLVRLFFEEDENE